MIKESVYKPRTANDYQMCQPQPRINTLILLTRVVPTKNYATARYSRLADAASRRRALVIRPFAIARPSAGTLRDGAKDKAAATS
jgi:hypothetical protein